MGIEITNRRQFVASSALAGTAFVAAGVTAPSVGRADETPAWDMEADVVVVGFGGAGACAAIEAADNGATVLLLEKNEEATHLSNTLMSGGIFYSPDRDGDPEALKAYIRALMSGDNVPQHGEGEMSPLFIDDMVNVFCEKVVENRDWLLDIDPDLEFIPQSGPAFPDYPGAEDSGFKAYTPTYTGSIFDYSYPTLAMDKYDTELGLAMHNCFKTGIAERPSIDVQWGTPAQSLITNKDGVVIGVAATQGDKGVRVKARRGVVLASGGFEYNKEMRRAFLGGHGEGGWAFYGTPSNTGDGIRMACEVGAQLAKVGVCSARMIFKCPDAEYNGLKAGINIDGTAADNCFMVNSHGARFANEGIITKNPGMYFSYKEALGMDLETLTYPNCPVYLVFDDEKLNAANLVNTFTGAGAFNIVPWGEDNTHAVEAGWIYSGETIEELAKNICANHDDNLGRMDATTLAETLQKWNETCETGVDEDFGRVPRTADGALTPVVTPPFHAIPLVPGGPNTKGGVEADARRRVVNWSNEPIPRLYSAGEMSSVFKWMYQSGGNITENIVCGRIAGANAAAEVPWDE